MKDFHNFTTPTATEEPCDQFGLLLAAEELSSVIVDITGLMSSIEQLTDAKTLMNIDTDAEDIIVFSKSLVARLEPALITESTESTIANVDVYIESILDNIADSIKKFISKLVALIKKLLPFLRNVDEKINNTVAKLKKAKGLEWKKPGSQVIGFDQATYTRVYNQTTRLNALFAPVIDFIYDNYTKLTRGATIRGLDKDISENINEILLIGKKYSTSVPHLVLSTDSVSPEQALESIVYTTQLYKNLVVLKKSLSKANVISVKQWKSSMVDKNDIVKMLTIINTNITTVMNVLTTTYKLVSNIKPI